MALFFTEPLQLDLLLHRAAAALGEDLGPDMQIAQPVEAETWQYDAVTNEARRTGAPGRRWQCLAGVEGPAVVVDIVEEAGDYTVVSVNRGTLAGDLNDAVAFAEAQLGDDAGGYLVRSMQVPALHFASLHLSGPSELLIPMSPPPAGGTDLTIAPISDLPRLLAPLAQRLGL